VRACVIGSGGCHDAACVRNLVSAECLCRSSSLPRPSFLLVPTRVFFAGDPGSGRHDACARRPLSDLPQDAVLRDHPRMHRAGFAGAPACVPRRAPPSDTARQRRSRSRGKARYPPDPAGHGEASERDHGPPWGGEASSSQIVFIGTSGSIDVPFIRSCTQACRQPLGRR
jgi:hypothetical protein